MVALLLVVGCTAESGSASWARFVMFEGVEYLEQDLQWDEPRLTELHLGEELGIVQANLSDSELDYSYSPRDGDAAVLPVGTPLREIVGIDPKFWIAAETSGGILLYQAFPSPDMTIGRDLYGDIAGQVVGISVNSVADGEPVLGRIDDQDTVDALTELLLGSEFDHSVQGHGQGLRYRLKFELEDLPPIRLLLFVDRGLIWPGLRVSAQFIEAVTDSVATSDA